MFEKSGYSVMFLSLKSFKQEKTMEVVAWHCLDTNQNRKNCEILRSSSINFYLGISDSSIIPQVIESQSIEKAYNYLKKTEIYSLIKAVICEKVKISQENLPYIVKLAKDGYAYFWDMEDLFWFLKFTRQLNFNARNVVELMQFVEKSNHSFKVAQLSKQVAEACGIKDFPWEDVLYHDIGKIAMPQSFLFAPRYYTQVERQFIQLHVVHGCNLAKKLNLNGNIKNFALYHHERYDGSGYLKGIRGDEIPKFVQIVTICDVYDALTSHRAYRSALDFELVSTFLQSKSGAWFNPELVTVLLDIVRDNTKTIKNWEGINGKHLSNS